MKYYKTIIITLITISSGSNTLAQNGIRLWYGHSATLRINKEWRVSGGQLFLFKTTPFEMTTLQNSLGLTYRLNSKVRFGMGYQKSFDPTNLTEEGRNRITGRISLAGKLQQIRIMHYFRAEWHFPERSKYEYRLRYAFRIHRRNWDLPLGARPYITNEFHYYLSGRPLWYRDEEGTKVVRQSPNGLHAHRITFGIRVSPIKRMNVNLRFMRQTEFNIGDKYREINVTDPRNGKVRRRFNNFSVLVLSTSYQFRIRKK